MCVCKFAGRGLGLAAIHGIVGAHGGALELQTGPHQGTTVRVYFPAAVSTSTEATVEDQPFVPEPSAEGTNRGSLLVVDDQIAVNETTRRMLKRLGYECIVALDGEMGVASYRAHHHSLEAVLLDLSMPKMNGLETFEAMRALSTDVPIILTSGHAGGLADGALPRDLAGYLHKPYSLGQLAEILDRVIVRRT